MVASLSEIASLSESLNPDPQDSSPVSVVESQDASSGSHRSRGSGLEGSRGSRRTQYSISSVMTTESFTQKTFDPRQTVPLMWVTSAFFFVCTPLCILCSVATSQVTHIGKDTYTFLRYHGSAKIIGETKMGSVAFGLGLLLVFVGYMSDMWYWPRGCCCVTILYGVATAMIVLTGVLLQTIRAPVIPIIVAFLLIFGAARLVRGRFPKTEIMTITLGESYAFCLTGVVLGVSWVLWAIETNRQTAHWSNELCLATRETMTHDPCGVMWASPAIISLGCVLVSLFCWARYRFYSHRDSDLPEGDTELVTADIGIELTVSCIILVVLALVGWIVSSLMVQERELATIVLQLSAFSAFLIVLYITDMIGFEVTAELIKQNQMISEVIGLVTSDWAKALFWLGGWWFIPVYLAINSVHHFLRKTCLQRLGLIPGVTVNSESWITESGHFCLAVVRSSDKGAIFLKSMYLGMAFFVVKAGVGQGLVVFLAWFNEQASTMHPAPTIFLLWFVEICLFLFPPVAGLPLYMLAAIVIVPMCGYDTPVNFWTGVMTSSLFCFVLKMNAIALEQKAIGVPFSTSVAVKKFIGIHTPLMKAVRLILTMPGSSLQLGKVAVLVGGPDWPTSVITGILDLPLGSMLLGSTPVIVTIVPCCIASGFLLRAAQETAPDIEAQYQAIADVMLVISLICQGGANVLGLYFLQAAMGTEECKMMFDPQEAEVLEAVKLDEERLEEMQRLTGWAMTPVFVRVVLVIGSLLSSATCASLSIKGDKYAPFEEFALTDKLSNWTDHNGHTQSGVLPLVRPTGWIACGIAALALLCLLIVSCWNAVATRNVGKRQSPTTASGLVSDMNGDLQMIPVGAPGPPLQQVREGSYRHFNAGQSSSLSYGLELASGVQSRAMGPDLSIGQESRGLETGGMSTYASTYGPDLSSGRT